MINSRSALVAILLCVTASVAHAKSMNILTKETYPIKLDGEAVTIIVGDSRIADVTAPSERLVLLTGYDAGTTNLLILDGDNNEILKADIVVGTNNKGVLTLRRGPRLVSRFICTDQCSAE